MIQINKETREKIRSLGKMGDTYDDVINRMYEQTIENMLAKKLLNIEDSKSIEEILKERKLI